MNLTTGSSATVSLPNTIPGIELFPRWSLWYSEYSGSSNGMAGLVNLGLVLLGKVITGTLLRHQLGMSHPGGSEFECCGRHCHLDVCFFSHSFGRTFFYSFLTKIFNLYYLMSKGLLNCGRLELGLSGFGVLNIANFVLVHLHFIQNRAGESKLEESILWVGGRWESSDASSGKASKSSVLFRLLELLTNSFFSSLK
jgi:hypothetical protein